MPPRDEQSEDDVQTAETRGKKPVPPRCGAEHGEAAKEHKTETHDGDDGDGECSSGHDAGSVKQQPRGRQGRLQAGTKEKKREEGSGQQRGSESKSDFAGGTREQREAASVRFPSAGQQSDGDGEQALGKPDTQPRELGYLARGQRGGDECSDAEKHSAPTRDGGERGGALHGVADEAQILCQIGGQTGSGARLRGPSGAMEAAKAVRARVEHDARIARP